MLCSTTDFPVCIGKDGLRDFGWYQMYWVGELQTPPFFRLKPMPGPSSPQAFYWIFYHENLQVWSLCKSLHHRFIPPAMRWLNVHKIITGLLRNCSVPLHVLCGQVSRSRELVKSERICNWSSTNIIILRGNPPQVWHNSDRCHACSPKYVGVVHLYYFTSVL